MGRAPRKLKAPSPVAIPAPPVPRLSYRIPDAVQATGLSRATLYRAIERGELSVFKVGTRTLIMASALQGFLDRHAQAA